MDFGFLQKFAALQRWTNRNTEPMVPAHRTKELERAHGPWTTMPLLGRGIIACGLGRGELSELLARTAFEAGASVDLIGTSLDAEVFRTVAERTNRSLLTSPRGPGGVTTGCDGVICDLSGMSDVTDFSGLHGLLNPIASRLKHHGRLVVCTRPTAADDATETSAVKRAVSGFTRSLAKELGAKAITVNILEVDHGAEARAVAALRFLLSKRSAFVTGQTLSVSRIVKGRQAFRARRPLEGRRALITGAAQGIGAAVARLMAAEGARVILLDRPAQRSPLEQLAGQLEGQAVGLDVTDAEAARTLSELFISSDEGIDIIVHNAGVTRDRTFLKMTTEQWSTALDVNLRAVMALTEPWIAAGPPEGGRLIVMSSIVGLGGNFGQTNYAASKAGVLGMVESLAPSLARRGVTANAIAPGFIDTEMTRAMPEHVRTRALAMNSLGQAGHPDDIAQAALFLASPGAAGITGSVLRVCGGHMMGA